LCLQFNRYGNLTVKYQQNWNQSLISAFFPKSGRTVLKNCRIISMRILTPASICMSPPRLRDLEQDSYSSDFAFVNRPSSIMPPWISVNFASLSTPLSEISKGLSEVSARTRLHPPTLQTMIGKNGLLHREENGKRSRGAIP